MPAATFIATASAVVALRRAAGGRRRRPRQPLPHRRAVEPALTVRDRARSSSCTSAAARPTIEPILRRRATGTGSRSSRTAPRRTARGFAAGRSDRSGDIAAWSFCQDKIMTTGRRGRRDHHLRRGRVAPLLGVQGPRQDLARGLRPAHPPGFRWLHDSFGTNARMTEVQAGDRAAASCSKLDGWVATRRAVRPLSRGPATYLDALRLPRAPTDVEHAFYRYYVELRPAARSGLGPRPGRRGVLAEGVPATHGGCAEIHRERAFAAVPGRRRAADGRPVADVADAAGAPPHVARRRRRRGAACGKVLREAADHATRPQSSWRLWTWSECLVALLLVPGSRWCSCPRRLVPLGSPGAVPAASGPAGDGEAFTIVQVPHHARRRYAGEPDADRLSAVGRSLRTRASTSSRSCGTSCAAR